jgi:hypothetical protein
MAERVNPERPLEEAEAQQSSKQNWIPQNTANQHI